MVAVELPVVIINAEAATNVQVADVKALGPDLGGKAHHDLRSIPEYVYLQPGQMLHIERDRVVCQQTLSEAVASIRQSTCHWGSLGGHFHGHAEVERALVIVDPRWEWTPTSWSSLSLLILSRNHCGHQRHFCQSL